MKATLEMALEALTNPSVIAVQHAIELIKAELAKPERRKSMTDLRKAANMALNALEFSLPAIEDFGSTEQLTDCHRAIMALYKSLAQPEQEPVCDKDPHLCGFVQCQLGKVCKNTPINTMPIKIVGPNLEQILNAAGFYRREWVGLTDDDHKDFVNRTKLLPILAKTLAEFIEAKLKEKNT